MKNITQMLPKIPRSTLTAPKNWQSVKEFLKCIRELKKCPAQPGQAFKCIHFVPVNILDTPHPSPYQCIHFVPVNILDTPHPSPYQYIHLVPVNILDTPHPSPYQCIHFVPVNILDTPHPSPYQRILFVPVNILETSHPSLKTENILSTLTSSRTNQTPNPNSSYTR